MGRELRRKQAKREGKSLQRENKNKEHQIKNFIIITIVLVLIIGLIYLLSALFITKELDWFKNEDEEVVEEPKVVVVKEEVVEEPNVVVVKQVVKEQQPSSEPSLARIPRNYTKFIATEVVGKDSRLAWISYKYYGVKDFWVYIYEANLDQVSSPNYVKPGQKLRIPALDSKYTDLNDPEVQKLLLYLSQEYTKH